MTAPAYHLDPNPVATHTHCRVCRDLLPRPYLDLGQQPLANALREIGTADAITAPLAVAKCQGCGLSQLTVVVDPVVLYSGYKFQSGVSRAWHVHCEDLVQQFDQPGFVIDIAANDGTQLCYFRRAGWKVLGVEPAELPPPLVGLETRAAPIPMLHTFWSEEVAQSIRVEHGRAHAIIAQNVLGHVDDVYGFFRGIKAALHPDGKCVIEVPDIGPLIRSTAFDTIYHEHVSYWSLRPLARAARLAGLALEKVDDLDVHGGSRRYWLVHRQHLAERSDTQVTRLLMPAVMDDVLDYTAFGHRVAKSIDRTLDLLIDLEDQGKRLWAFGASAKGAVTLNVLKEWGNAVWPEVVLDDTPEKQGLWMPGVDIPVSDVPEGTSSLAGVDVIWILSWNWAPIVKARCRALGFTGQFLVTVPEPRLEE